MRFRIAAVVVLILVAASACGPGQDGFTIRGRLLDGNTGEPVSRSTLYVHFFCDHVGFKESQDPKDDPEFLVRTPERKVRIRVHDTSGAYELFEENVLVMSDSLEYDILLAPTGHVLLRGRVIEKATGLPPAGGRGIGGKPLFYLGTEGGFAVGPISADADGTYGVRVPREQVRIRFVNTALAPKDDMVDLTGITADEHAFDIVLE